MITTAHVSTTRAARYAKQLASHMSRRIITEWDAGSGRGALEFPFGIAEMHATDDGLRLTARAEADDVNRIEEVVGKHLVRFGSRDELVCRWFRDSGEPGTVWTNDLSAE